MLRLGQDTAIFMTCRGLDGSRGVERRLWACTSFRLSGGGTSTFSAGVAGTRSSFRVSCVHHEMNALCEGLVYEPVCSESEPCSEVRVTMAARVSGTPFGNAGSCVLLGAVNALVREVDGGNCGEIYLDQVRPFQDVHQRSYT